MNIDPEKILVVLVIALLVLGPERLPQAARSLGKGLAHFRRYSAVFRGEMDHVLAEPRAMVEKAMREVDVRSELRTSLTGLSHPLAVSAPLAAQPVGESHGSTNGNGSAEPAALSTTAEALHTAPLEPLHAAPVYRGPGGHTDADALPEAAPDEPGLN